MLRQVLEHAGARVRTANSAADALEQWVVHEPDLLISDIGLPGVDGYELLRQIRANAALTGALCLLWQSPHVQWAMTAPRRWLRDFRPTSQNRSTRAASLRLPRRCLDSTSNLTDSRPQRAAGSRGPARKVRGIAGYVQTQRLHHQERPGQIDSKYVLNAACIAGMDEYRRSLSESTAVSRIALSSESSSESPSIVVDSALSHVHLYPAIRV